MTKTQAPAPAPQAVASHRHDAETATLDPLSLLKNLVTLERLIEMYPPGHPTIAEKLRELVEMVRPHLQMNAAVEIEIIHDEIYLNGISWPYERQASSQVVGALADLGVNSLHIERGVQAEEFRAAAECLSVHGRTQTEPIGVQLERRDVQHITLKKLVPLDTRWRVRRWPDRPDEPIDPAHAAALAVAERTFKDVASGGRIDPITVTDLVHLLIGQLAQNNVALGRILAVKEYENLTFCHSINVAVLSVVLGRQLQLNEPAMAALVEAALLHDVGKAKIPLDIVNKPGALTKQERKVVEEHTFRGAEILVETQGLQPLTATVALEHHRTVVGGGYPDLGSGVVPHIMSQVVSVADIYEALTGARSYRAPYPPEKACLILARSAGTQLNTTLVKAFVSAIGFFPPGSLVRTSLDEKGIVVRTNPNEPLHPVVMLVGDDLQPSGREIDTSARDASGVYERCILETLPLDGRSIDVSGVSPAPGGF